jgi:hypothetical protein
VLSNSNLPFWNDQDNITFWIRMAIHKDLEPTIVVSVNCDNAEGINQRSQNPIMKNKKIDECPCSWTTA